MTRIPNINLLSDEWMSLWYRTKACLWNVDLLNNGLFPKTHPPSLGLVPPVETEKVQEYNACKTTQSKNLSCLQYPTSKDGQYSRPQMHLISTKAFKCTKLALMAFPKTQPNYPLAFHTHMEPPSNNKFYMWWLKNTQTTGKVVSKHICEGVFERVNHLTWLTK